ncbi:MAG: hypothetical protein IJG80_09380 [Selenomonadaceae bacterium]|nr:hypothetical protein [Selenomonadaceae bacterium]MBQ3433713.1 hypothetical protein [Selenomonadaceae bacterium]
MFENFSWKAGTSFPVKAETAAKTIRDLQKTLGKDSVTAKELLDDSRDVNAPLHPCFEWNDSIAAEKYRLDQARRIIGSIEVRYIGDKTPPKPIRAFLCVTPSPTRQQGEFVGIDVILSKENYRKQVLSNALIELRAFQRKYSTQEELLGVFKAIDAFADTLQ